METLFAFTPPDNISDSQRTNLIKTKYSEWTYHMTKVRRCRITMGYLTRKLHVSRKWVYEHICPNVEYCKITLKRLKELGFDAASPLLFNEDELREFLKTNCIFTRQTVIIDLDSEMTASEKEAYMAEPLIRRFDSRHKETYGLRSPRLLEILGSRFSNVDARSRSDYEALNVEHFDFWDKQLFFLSDYTSNERAYRDFFRLGMIKITMFGKVFFVKDIETDKVLYPMTVSYDEYLSQRERI